MKSLEEPVIVTERLRLRPVVHDDADAIFALFANWNVVRRLSSPPWPYTRAEAGTFIDGVASGTGDYPETAFAILHEGDLIGLASYRMRPQSHLQRGAGPNIGYWLGEPYWGNGYMTEAVRGLAAMIFETGDPDMIFSGAFSDNKASLRVQQKVGFVVDGETTLFSRPRNGSFPHINTVLTRAGFEAHGR